MNSLIKELFYIVPVSHIAWHDDLIPFAIAFSSGDIIIGDSEAVSEPEKLTVCQVNKFIYRKKLNILYNTTFLESYIDITMV